MSEHNSNTKLQVNNYASLWSKIPYAEKVPYSFTMHGTTYQDDLHWLKQKNWYTRKEFDNLKIKEYLDAEAQYAKDYFSLNKREINKIYTEIKGLIKLEDKSIPCQIDEHEFKYYAESKQNLNYYIYRRINMLTGEDSVILDINQLAQDKKHINNSFQQVSPDHKLLAYGISYDGDEKFDIQVKDIDQNQIIDSSVKGTLGGIVWHDNGFFYTPVSDQWTAKEVHYYNLGTKSSHLIYREDPDSSYSVNIAQMNNKHLMAITTGDQGSSCIRVYDLNKIDISKNFSEQEFYIFHPIQEVEHGLSDSKDSIFILTNKNSPNFEVQKMDLATKEISSFIPPSEIYITGISTTSSYLIIEYKENCLDKVRVINLSSLNADKDYSCSNADLQTIYKHSKIINFDDEVYSASAGGVNFVKDIIWTNYSSPTTPSSTYEYNFTDNSLNLLKQTEIPAGHNPQEYEAKLIFAGEVPISLVYKKALFKHDGTNPLYLVGYGAYGICNTARFRSSWRVLLDRGFVCAIAHVRGGSDINYEWYSSGKLLNKMNTFIDFEKATKALIEQKYTSAGRIAIVGGSAGGLLIGNALNRHPELYGCAVAHVPFVDIIQTMLDDTLPLTKQEYQEWGDPNDPTYFHYILQYDVYRNTDGSKYPNLLITAGLNDPRVSFWEPAKWMAKIRADQRTKFYNDNAKTSALLNNETSTTNADGPHTINTQDQNPPLSLFKLEEGVGHSGKSGRDNSIREVAEEIVFILNSLNISI